jgi:amino acid transporter
VLGVMLPPPIVQLWHDELDHQGRAKETLNAVMNLLDHTLQSLSFVTAQSVMITLCFFMFVLSLVFTIRRKRRENVETLIDFWTQIINFWMAYMAFNVSFPSCHQHLQDEGLIVWFVAMELFGRGLIFFVVVVGKNN